MNPSAPSFNPNASAFVPKTFVPPANPVTPAPQPTQKPVQKPAEKVQESWDEEEKSPKPTTDTKSVEKKIGELKIDDEAIKKELARMAAEEGITEEELLKDDETSEAKTEDGKVEVIEKTEDEREHLNIVFIGHVDAGKSTISGSLLVITGMIDPRLVQKYEKEAKDNNRESWFLAYIMDTNEEERKKGKTVEVGRADFETKVKRYTILDAPGHKAYVPNMIGGASQADVGVLVISAKKGEFESGFTKAGQTKEHTMLAKTLGIKVLVVVVNKMDDPTVKWQKERYDEIVGQLLPYAKQCGYNPKDVHFIPISGLVGSNLSSVVSKEICPWYEGGTLLDLLDSLKPMERLNDAPLRIPIVDKYKDRGLTFLMGKVESGSLAKGDQLLLVPGKIPVEVQTISLNDVTSVKIARAGENVKLGLRGVEDEQVHRGFVLCDKVKPIPCQAKFEAQIAVLELLPHKSIFCAGYNAIIHIHTAVEECTITLLVSQLDKKTGAVTKKRPQFVKSGALVSAIVECSQAIPMELFADNPQLGRFSLRDEGKTVAIGKVVSLGPKKKST